MKKIQIKLQYCITNYTKQLWLGVIAFDFIVLIMQFVLFPNYMYGFDSFKENWLGFYIVGRVWGFLLLWIVLKVYTPNYERYLKMITQFATILLASILIMLLSLNIKSIHIPTFPLLAVFHITHYCKKQR